MENNRIIKLLLVDDSDDDRLVFKRAMRKSDIKFEITEFSKPADALAYLEKGDYDLDIIVTDFNMPQMNGMELCEKLLADKIPLPLVILTGGGSETVAVEALKLGVYDYIIKDSGQNYMTLLPESIKSVVDKHGDRRARILAETALQESERRFRDLSNLLPQSIFEADLDSNVTYANRQAHVIFGLDENEPVGTINIEDFISPDFIEKARNNIQLALSGESTTDNEFLLKKTNGEEFPALLFIAPAIMNDKPVGIRGVITDITELKKTQMELEKAKEESEEANKLKDKFVSLVSHDLKNPIHVISGYMQLLMDEEDPEERREFCKISLKSCEDMTSFINEVLSLNRIRSGEILPQKTFFNTKRILDEVSGKLAPLANTKTIAFVNKIPTGMRIHADERLYREVMHNILSNAVKFSKNNSEINIFQKEGKPASVCIADTGVGISPANLENLFKFEVKTSTTGTAGEQGTGFGMPLANEIILAHDGEIIVTSTPGQGSEFEVSLPETKPYILVVDDDMGIREVIKIILKQLNVEVETAENGAEAWEKIKQKMPDLAILDVEMPVMDGIELLKKIRTTNATENLRVVIQSFTDDVEKRNEIFRIGADDFIPKPVKQEELIPRIRKFIS